MAQPGFRPRKHGMFPAMMVVQRDQLKSATGFDPAHPPKTSRLTKFDQDVLHDETCSPFTQQNRYVESVIQNQGGISARPNRSDGSSFVHRYSTASTYESTRGHGTLTPPAAETSRPRSATASLFQRASEQPERVPGNDGDGRAPPGREKLTAFRSRKCEPRASKRQRLRGG